MKVGGGLLLNWLDVAPGAEADFLKWHTREHVPERVSLPGFLSGARLVAASDVPPEPGHGLLIAYEAQSPAAFTSAAYRARLDDPTPLTRQMLPGLRQVTRGIYRAEALWGAGQGGHVATLRFNAPPEGFAGWVAQLDRLAGRAGMISVLLGRPDIRRSRMKGTTAEGRSTDSQPEDPSWCLVLQASHREALEEAAARALPGPGSLRLHRFRRVFTLARAELSQPAPASTAQRPTEGSP